MPSFTIRVTVGPDHTVCGVAPDGVPPGSYVAQLDTPAQPGRQLPSLPFDPDALPTRNLGPWPEELSPRREEMYGEDGR